MRGAVAIVLLLVICAVGVVHNPFNDVNVVRKKRDVNYIGDTESVDQFILNDVEKPKIRHHHGAELQDQAFLEKDLAKQRVLGDRGRRINRRKRYSYVRNGVVHYGSNRVVQCVGWTYYNPCNRCEKKCPTRVNRPPAYYPNSGTKWEGLAHGCNCNPRGSELKTCDIVTGQCRCKPFYTSRTCSDCLKGYWDSPAGCIKCECDQDGSSSEDCDQRNGNCHCNPGIEGKNCDTCKPGHYGFSKTGCKECDVCNKAGHICDPDTGRCVCPPHSHGSSCSLCKINTWGYEPNQGCKPCGCSDTGSIKMQCNSLTGECMCQQGYTGPKCNTCIHGYYGYPKCRRCSCNVAGTDKIKGKCESNGICQCHPDGTCPCKLNVSGKRCVTCKDGTFDLDHDNPDGCTKCFCFGRTSLCTGAGFTWGKIRSQNRTMEIDFMDKGNIKLKQIWSNDIIDISNFEEIEGTTGNVKKFHDHFDIPLYWKLPANFIGDHVLSYGGYLRFSTSTENPIEVENDLFKQYPLVRIEGNNFKFISFPLALNNKYEIRFHESLWQRINANDSNVSRELLMTTLQNITGIYIKATDHSKFSKVTLSDVSLDSAIKVLGNPPPMAKGVEKCVCSKEYNGTSCQNPNRGYFRQKPDNPPTHGNILNNIDAIIGKSVKCQCNNRSEICDIETGECLNCNANTAGKSCEHCAEGYYGDPMNGKCMACACPSINQNFAISCSPIPRSKKFNCVCKEGYEGLSCEKCSSSYYRDRSSPEGKCIPCNCNAHGSISDECDEYGSCICKPGITGQTCSQCEESRHILENNYCIPCDNCTQLLLDDIENLAKHLDDNTIHLQNGVVAPPWKSLTDIENRYLKFSSDVVEYLDKQDELNSKIDIHTLKQLENETFIIKKNLDNKEDELKSVLKLNEANRERANSISNDLKKTKSDLDVLIKSLNNFGKSTISTEDAVQQGQQSLNEIGEFYKKLECLHPPIDVNAKCKELKASVQKMMNEFKFADTKKLKKQILELKSKYLELEDILAGIDVKNEKVMKRNKNNREKYLEVKKKLNKLYKDHEELKQQLDDKKKLIDDIEDMLNKIEINYDEFIKIRDQNDELLQQVEEKESLIDDSITMLENYKSRIDDHAERLNKSVSNYISQFHLSNKELDAVNASRRYKEILEIFNDANKTLMEAKEEFSNISNTTLEPDTGDSIYDDSLISKAASDRLVKRNDNLNSQITGFSERLNKLYSQIEDIKGHNWKNGITNNGLLERLNQLAAYSKIKIGDFKKIEIKIRKVVEASDKMRKVYKDAVNINISKNYNLNKNYLKLLNLTSAESVRKFQDDIKLTKDILYDISKFGTKTNIDIIKEMNKGTAGFNREKSNMEMKLEALRASVKKAEQIASYIRVPISGSNCARSYKIINLEPTTVMKISIDFESNNGDGDLLYLSNGQQYINLKFKKLENNNGEVQLLYKFTNESQLKAKISANEEVSITIRRSNTKIELLINNIQKDFKAEDNKLFNVTAYDLLYIGKSSKDIETGIPGCIKDMTINDYRLGFWKFEETSGNCTGCNRNNTIRSNDRYRFNGNGYISDNSTTSKTDPSQINIKLKMTTFDENSLIFLAYHSNTYMALQIRDGYICCEIHYNNKKIMPIIIKSQIKYNNNQKVSIDCTKQFSKNEGDKVRFLINEEPVDDDVSRVNVQKTDILKIKKSTLYYGGVPPDFENKKFIDQSFLGLLEEVSFTRSSFSLQDNKQFYGVDLYDNEKDISYHQVLFDKSGYLHLNISSNSLRKINFILRTELEHAFVFGAEDIEFYLQGGKIVANYAEHRIESDVLVNNDEYNQIELVWKNKQLSLFVNGNEEGNINAKSEKHNDKYILIYIGGKKGLENKFEGVIKDIFINDKILDINSETYLDSLGAKIGRSKPIKKRYVEISESRPETVNMDMKDMQQTDTCDKINYSLEPNAVKFGDAPNSYIQHFVKDNQRKGNFSIDFEFRTFYKNGLLYFMQGPRENYNLIEVREGKLAIVIGAKQTNYFILGSRIDDGNWHHISIQYFLGKVKKAKITIAIDGEIKRHNIRQKKIGGKLYFGDIPKSSWSNLPQTAKSQPFRGCMRSMKINSSPLGLIHNKNTALNNIGQCFPNIELGSYFRGDAFAIYKNEFPLKNFLEVSFEFRTSEQNGILLSVSHPDNNPALSIELQNGEVVMSVDMGNGIISNVTSKIAKYIICNNKWHHIRAIFSSELTVIVDRVGNSWVLSETGFEEQIEEPLYIGGLPDSAAGGTLKIRENFKGCIRNLLINNEQIDWINMYDLNNVSLNSCPVIL